MKKNGGNTKIYFDYTLEWTICLMNINVYVNVNEKKKFNSVGLHSNRSQILTKKRSIKVLTITSETIHSVCVSCS
jgi:hypothetical protein